MNKIFYSKLSSDWFFYYILFCIYGFFLNFATPFLGPEGELNDWNGFTIIYFINIFLGIVSFIFVPIQVRKRKFYDNEYYQSSSVMTFIGWMLVIILFIVNLNSTFVLLLVSTN